VLQKYPSKFVGCCLADPTDGGGGVKELQRLVEDEGYRAVRFNPYLWPSGQKVALNQPVVHVPM
jgi:predicted TIM-barrel fold metal-dependent hydrolase